MRPASGESPRPQVVPPMSSPQVELSSHWDVLGPFPIHAREQHYLSPAFPLNLSDPIDLQKRWSSSYADGGHVGWTKTDMNELGELKVSFPDVRWRYLRSFGGWAALQHHAVLLGSFKITGEHTGKLPNLMVHLHQGSYFTVMPMDPLLPFVPKWYAGNVYDIPRSLPHTVDLPPSNTREYRIFISGDYEIRLFGDPVIQEGSDVPVQHIKIDIAVDKADGIYIREESQDVICDFVDGFAFGTAIGIGLRSASGWVTVTNATVNSPSKGIALSLVKQTRLASGQTRLIPLKIEQSSPIQATSLEVILTLDTTAGKAEHLSVILPLQHLPKWSAGLRNPLRASFLYTPSNPVIFVVLPPLLPNKGKDNPPILALHGAGVDIAEIHLKFWADAMPKNDLSWVIMPQGRTSWGLDWHGPDTHEALGAVSALSFILQKNRGWKSQAFSQDAKVILIGHSNGGQGVWHISSHFPDRVVAAVPAAAYIKSQAYIPLTQSRSSHYIDPILRAILESSLTPDDNDLHLTNIARLPLLAIHGGADGNVPSWHSRELINILHAINPKSSASLVEDVGEDHWYPSVLNNPSVNQFLEAHLQLGEENESKDAESFTLTVFSPSETGSLNGWQIHSLLVPGRLASLAVTSQHNGIMEVRPTNVLSFSIQMETALLNVKEIDISSTTFSTSNFTGVLVLFKMVNGHWEIATNEPPPSAVPTRLQSILSSTDTINIVYHGEPALSLASRLAHDLYLYHRLDSALIPETDPLDYQNSPGGNLVIIGTLKSPFIQHLLKRASTSFSLRHGKLFLDDKLLPTDSSESYMFLHPGVNKSSYILVIIYSDESSLERAGKLFPMRTGVAAPNWLLLSPRIDRLGAAGLHGAGVWSADWAYQQASSWLIS